jgi:predicted TIM-barrel fold metal-dependent hydrolase
MSTAAPVISADSHISETEACFADIDPRFRDRRPRQIHDEKVGAVLRIPDLDIKVPMGVICTAGRTPEEFGKPVRWEELHPAGHDPKARLAIQDEEGVRAELLYPSLGMVLCNHPDPDYKKACFDAYNRWLAEFCATDPKRLLGVGMAAVRTVGEGIEELRAIADMGFRAVMLPGDPVVHDYDHPDYAPFWEACIDLGLPVNFHILTSKGDIAFQVRGPRISQQILTVRGVQNLLSLFTLGAVFERHPALRVVFVESDVGWVPHWSFRMDHAWDRHRHWMEVGALSMPPSEYVRRNAWFTFQDDRTVRLVKDDLDLEHVLWATDFPHSDGTYPHSRRVIEEVTEGLSEAQRRAITHDNAARLYGL